MPTDAFAIAVTVENTGDRVGRDVVQAYVRPPAVDGIERPAREFAGAQSVALDSGASRSVTLDLDELACSRYDDGWTVDSGRYTVAVGRSAADMRTTVAIER